MTEWVAVSYGALDVSALDSFGETELLVTPIHPAVPLALFGVGAALWRRLATEGPVPDDALDDAEREIVRDMEEMGLASRDAAHVARMLRVDPPWLSSPMHELVYALVASIAREHDVRAVFIKGPVLHAQGLRDREHSGDVDVWVEPEVLMNLVGGLGPWGWEQQPDLWGGEPINHSVTMEPTAEWGCEIDVHRRLPGLALSDSDAFAAVVGRTSSFGFAGVDALAPNVPTHAVLAAVHVLRPEIGRGQHPDSASRAARVLGIIGVDAIVSAVELGALCVVRSQLTELFPASASLLPRGGSPRDWWWRSQPTKARAYAMVLNEVVWWKRPTMVFRLIWPRAAVARTSERLAGALPLTRGARLRRLRRGLCELTRERARRLGRRV